MFPSCYALLRRAVKEGDVVEADRAALGANAIDRATQFSPFLRGALARHPDIAALAAAGRLDDALRASCIVAEDDVAPRLRRIRDRLALAVALGDLAGVFALERVVTALSDFADQAVDAAIRAALPGDAQPGGFAAIALGKHGSRELNYSSDIDLIFIYDPRTLPRRARDDPAEAAVRIARRIVELLQTRDANGYVFRVDLRLRPASEATPLALPVEAAISHYESSALGWERAAFIRARAAAGDVALGRRFLDAIGPFVWRRSLDFGAIAELRALTHRIRTHHRGQAFAPGYDLKRGRGGIREAEFFAQIHQLIHGGRDPELRAGATLTALEALAAAGWIERAAAHDLGTAYRLLRTIEHRAQMIEDRQTHLLPEDPAALEGLARLHGLAGGDALLELLRPHVERVGTLYDALDADSGGAAAASPLPADALRDRFAHSGFADPEAAAQRVVRWRTGGVRAVRSPAALAAFEAVLPGLIAAFGAAPDPDDAIARFDRVLGRLSTAINLFRLVDARPALQALLVDIVSHAPALADALAARPALFDRLIDHTALGPLPNIPSLIKEMSGSSAIDIELALDRVRHVVGEYRFALGTQIVAGAADPLVVAAGYARVAEAALRVVADRVGVDFEKAHGRVPGSEFVVVALGRLGGGLLSHASDLDLIYLFTGDFGAESNGPKPLGATLYYNRLGQRVTAGLAAPTSVGPLYEVDTRLRPSGTQGPLVVSVDSFERYQREAAWTWEHMALMRARPVFGSAEARAEVAAIIAATLAMPRDRAALARDVLSMRSDVATHKPAAGPLDVKLAPGGLVDLEFIVHFHQLATGVALTPDLKAAIETLASAGIVDAGLGAAHDLLTRLLVTVRLVAPDMAAPGGGGRALLARACATDDWAALMAALDAARQCVTSHWNVIRAAGEE